MLLCVPVTYSLPSTKFKDYMSLPSGEGDLYLIGSQVDDPRHLTAVAPARLEVLLRGVER